MRAQYLRVADPVKNTSMVLPSQCGFCETPPAALEVDGSGFYRWTNGGEYLQNAFPDMPAGERELLMSGTHPACWDAAFPDEED